MFEGVKKSIGRALARELGKYNSFNDAFFSTIGGNITKYDTKNPVYLEKGYQYNSDVYSIIKQISTKCSDIPCNIKKVKNRDAQKQLKLIKTSKSYHHILKRIQLEVEAYEESSGMPLPLEKPNTQQSWSEFIALSVVFLKLTGNCFWYALTPELRDDAEPLQLYVLPADLIYIVLKSNPEFLGVESPVESYKLIEGNMYVDFKAKDVMHIKNPNPDFDMSGSHLYGQSDLKAVLRNLQSSNEAIDNNIKTMSNGGAFGLLHSKGQNILTEPQAKALKEKLVEMDSNSGRLSKISGVSAEIGFIRIALTTDELKPFEYLGYDQKAICNALGWYIDLLNSKEGSSGLNNGAMDQVRRRAITDTCMPLLNQFEEAFNSWFLPKFKSYKGYEIEFDPTELPEMQADMEKLSKWAKDGVDGGMLNRDEWRQIMKFNPIGTPEMKAYTVGMNVMSLEDALVPLENEVVINE